nr:eukaryotictranslation initiation factor 3 [Hymenolepis microstoma]
MTSQTDSDLAFLDVLLVNAEKYNQVFIQKTKPSWISHILPRLIRSPVHFNKMFEILVEVVVSERHPDWARRALQWLTKIFDNPEASEMAKQCTSSMHRFVSYCSEMNGIGKLVDSTLKYINYKRENEISRPRRGGIVVVDTKYLFIDDPQIRFGAFKKRPKKEEESGIEGSGEDLNNGGSDDHCSELSLDDGDNSSVSEDEVSEDDGVFDVDRNSLSSFTESQNSTFFPQPRTARVERIYFKNDDDSDAQIGTDENVSDNVESEEEEEEEGDDMLNIDQPLPSSSEDEPEVREDGDHGINDSDAGSDKEVPTTGQEPGEEENVDEQRQQNSISSEVKTKVAAPRRSARIKKMH